MELLLISLASVAAAALTLFSGFGLGTLLMPVFALFFPLPVAVAATAAVHLANNLFKAALVGRGADRRVVLVFGLPALAAAFAGAALLSRLGSGLGPVMGILIILFALLDLVPAFANLSFDRRWLPLGGALSGFLGGLSGHQGALRSAFLIKLNLSRDSFIATGVWIAVLVDLARLAVYGGTFLPSSLHQAGTAIGVATIAAFAGSFIGARLVRKSTVNAIRNIVAAMLILIGSLLMAGVL